MTPSGTNHTTVAANKAPHHFLITARLVASILSHYTHSLICFAYAAFSICLLSLIILITSSVITAFQTTYPRKVTFLNGMLLHEVVHHLTFHFLLHPRYLEHFCSHTISQTYNTYLISFNPIAKHSHPYSTPEAGVHAIYNLSAKLSLVSSD